MSKEMDFAQLVAQEDEIKILLAECAELRGRIEQLETELQQARQTAEFWKAEHLSGNKLIDELRAKIAALEVENKRLREAPEALCGLAASRDAPELNSGDMLAFCGPPATSFPKG